MRKPDFFESRFLSHCLPIRTPSPLPYFSIQKSRSRCKPTLPDSPYKRTSQRLRTPITEGRTERLRRLPYLYLDISIPKRYVLVKVRTLCRSTENKQLFVWYVLLLCSLYNFGTYFYCLVRTFCMICTIDFFEKI